MLPVVPCRSCVRSSMLDEALMGFQQTAIHWALTWLLSLSSFSLPPLQTVMPAPLGPFNSCKYEA